MQKCPWELSIVFRVLRSTVGERSSSLQRPGKRERERRRKNSTIDCVDPVRNDLLESSQPASPMPVLLTSTKSGNTTDNNNNNTLKFLRDNINTVVSRPGFAFVLGNDRVSLIQRPIANSLDVYKSPDMQIYPYLTAIISNTRALGVSSLPLCLSRRE